MSGPDFEDVAAGIGMALAVILAIVFFPITIAWLILKWRRRVSARSASSH
jgi:uncharacterized membrane protein